MCLGVGSKEGLPSIQGGHAAARAAYGDRFAQLLAGAGVLDRAVLSFDDVLCFWAGPRAAGEHGVLQQTETVSAG